LAFSTTLSIWASWLSLVFALTASAAFSIASLACSSWPLTAAFAWLTRS